MSIEVRIAGTSVLMTDTVNLGSVKIHLLDATNESNLELIKLIKNKLKKNLVINLLGNNLITLTQREAFRLSGIVTLDNVCLSDPEIIDSKVDNSVLLSKHQLFIKEVDVSNRTQFTSEQLVITDKEFKSTDDIKPKEEVTEPTTKVVEDSSSMGLQGGSIKLTKKPNKSKKNKNKTNDDTQTLN